MSTEAEAFSPSGSPIQGTTPSERIGALDVLRGIAMLGMFLVHFNDYSSKGSGLANTYSHIVGLFFEERFYTMFAILFGVGFALQLRRSEARGDRFVPKYVRRLTALMVIGLAAVTFFGFYTLLSYAIWGFPLLLVRNWSKKAILAAVVVCVVVPPIFAIASTAYGVSTTGKAAYAAQIQAEGQRNREIRKQIVDGLRSPHYASIVAARLHEAQQLFLIPRSVLRTFDLVLFLLGALALRLQLFDRTRERQRLILLLMVFGVVSWGLVEWVVPLIPSASASGSRLMQVTVGQLRRGFGLLRIEWMSFAYIGVVLLLIAHNPAWMRRLAAFGWTGRMALTNYVLQIAIIDLTIKSVYGFRMSMTPLVAAGAALTLFALNALLSRWWLARFRYGPLEWLWRSATYARMQQWRIHVTAPVVPEPA